MHRPVSVEPRSAGNPKVRDAGLHLGRGGNDSAAPMHAVSDVKAISVQGPSHLVQALSGLGLSRFADVAPA